MCTVRPLRRVFPHSIAPGLRREPPSGDTTLTVIIFRNVRVRTLMPARATEQSHLPVRFRFGDAVRESNESIWRTRRREKLGGGVRSLDGRTTSVVGNNTVYCTGTHGSTRFPISPEIFSRRLFDPQYASKCRVGKLNRRFPRVYSDFRRFFYGKLSCREFNRSIIIRYVPKCVCLQVDGVRVTPKSRAPRLIGTPLKRNRSNSDVRYRAQPKIR